MSRHQLSRGRPKGSGLDDRSTLIALTRLLNADPKLKPTTAIRSMGVSDPSTVRRLREKLRTARVAQERAPVRAAAKIKAERVQPTSDTLARRDAGEKRTPSTPPGAFDKSWLVQWYDLGIFAIASTVAVQMAALESLLATSPVALAFKQHVAFNKGVMAFCGSLPDVRKTLH